MSTGPDPSGGDAVTTLQDRPAAMDVAHEEAEIAAALGGAHAQEQGEAASAPAAPSTRDLLAEVASRQPHEPRPAALERSERRFVRWLLVATVAALVVLFAALWWLDPISVTGRQTRFSVVENGGVRQAKLDLMQELEQAPEVLILGSSRSMKLDPEHVERVSGATAFNGAVSGGTSQDMYLYARYAADLWDGEREYPHLVLGVVNDVFRYTGTAAFDPRLRRYLPRSERDRDPLEVADQLLQVKTLEAAVRAVRAVVPRDGAGALLDPEQDPDAVEDAALATEGRQAANQRDNLSPRGMQVFDPAGDYSKPLSSRIDEQMETFVERAFDADPTYTGMDERGLDMLVRTIRLANERGDVPTLWVTPYHPDARRYLPAAYADRDARFRETIEQLQRRDDLQFEFVDLDDLERFGGDPDDFFDGIHMSERNTERVIEHLHELGLLAPRRTS